MSASRTDATAPAGRPVAWYPAVHAGAQREAADGRVALDAIRALAAGMAPGDGAVDDRVAARAADARGDSPP